MTMLNAGSQTIDRYLLRDQVFERCQSGDGMRAAPGEAGQGVYAYPAGMRAMRAYYGAQGEDVFRITMLPEAVILDLTAPVMVHEVIRFARDEMRQSTFGGMAPAIRPETVHRFGWTIESFVAAKAPDVDGWLVRHHGPGLPTGKQVVIRDIRKFEVSGLNPAPGLDF